MPTTFGQEASLVMTRSMKPDAPTFQVIPPIILDDPKKGSRASDSGISSSCMYCNSGNTSASTCTGIPSHAFMQAIGDKSSIYDTNHYLTPDISMKNDSNVTYQSDTTNNNNNDPSPTPSRSSHQAVTAYCYCSQCTGRPQRPKTKMYSKFKTASHAARAMARFESSLTAKETETMFDHRPRGEDHIKTEHGCFRKSIPSMPLYIALPCCLFNFFFPGLGTLIATVSIFFGCTTEYGNEQRCKSITLGFMISMIQVTTAIFVLGWVWSIMWGINFVKRM